VGRLLELPAHTLMRGIQIEAPFTGQGDRTYIFFHRALNRGYGWVFPKGQVANVGIGVASDPEGKSAELLECFVTGVARLGLIRPGTLGRWGGPIPVSGLREELVVRDVLFCGDAAGLTHPITGAGIAQAVFSGELAGRAAAEALQTGRRAALADYDREVRARFSGVLAHALSKKRFLSDNWDSPDFRAICQRTWITFRGYHKRERATT